MSILNEFEVVEPGLLRMQLNVAPQNDGFNQHLDSGSNYSTGVDLLKHIDDAHPLKRMTAQVAAMCNIPQSSTFLILISAFSSVTCRKWLVDYQFGRGLPIGLYACVEGPSGIAKSRALESMTDFFIDVKNDVINKYQTELLRLGSKQDRDDADEGRLDELKAMKRTIYSRLFVNNATPEGLEATLGGTCGYFSAVSSEQGLFNSLLGLSYANGAANNNDLLLNGFDGGFVSSCRVSREGYHGRVIGGVTLFAQQGSVEKILSASNGTGLSERFLMLAEPHFLGKRDHLKKIFFDRSIPEAIKEKCQFAREVFENPIKPGELYHLKISDTGHRLIAEYRNQIEPHLADGAKFSHISLRGAAAKVDMQIMKLAANLWLLARNDEYDANIPDDHVKAAIGISNDLLEANLALCKAKGLIGVAAEFSAVLRLFEGNHKPMTERQIIQSRSRVEPFKDFTGNKSDLIRQTLCEMVSTGVLDIVVYDDGVKRYSLNQ
ncbi:DUF3987 domain-containing protein [Methylotuvimicrobium sp. KM2]|uniref:DUF3987 domain-containing protein n=1 Tax=Methylotuvimicrobium sp. KM2 TaxID=3133976 RepID=UPI0031016BA8